MCTHTWVCKSYSRLKWMLIIDIIFICFVDHPWESLSHPKDKRLAPPLRYSSTLAPIQYIAAHTRNKGKKIKKYQTFSLVVGYPESDKGWPWPHLSHHLALPLTCTKALERAHAHRHTQQHIHMHTHYHTHTNIPTHTLPYTCTCAGTLAQTDHFQVAG